MNSQLLLSLISGIFISGVAGYLGTLMLSRKMSVVAGPLAHLSLPGAAIALFLVGVYWLVFSLLFFWG
jgi:hypothetical protein